MKPAPGAPSRVAEVLGGVWQRIDPDEQRRAYAIWTFWDDAVGEGIARRAQPASLRNGVLFVTVATHSWMQELQFMKQDILQRLNARLDADLVRDISFNIGPVATAPAAQPAASDAPPCEPVALPPVADPELAAALARVAAARARHLTRIQRAQATRPRRRTSTRR